MANYWIFRQMPQAAVKTSKLLCCILLIAASAIFYTASAGNSMVLWNSSTLKSNTDDKLKEGGPSYDLESEKEKGPREAIVVIDPGHGGEELGGCYGTMMEKTLNLDIAKRMGPILKKEGIKTVYTRETDVFVDLDERSRIANTLDAVLFISVHNNKMPGDSAYRGTEILYTVPEGHGKSKMDGERLATLVQRELVKNLKTVNHGIIYRPNLSVLRKTKMPAVIAEIAYMSNASDRKRLRSDSFKQKAAESLCRAVVKALKEMDVQKNRDGRWMTPPK